MEKTTLAKLISEIDFNNTSLMDTPDWSGLSNLFGIYELDYNEDPRLKTYFVKRWYCTDRFVGLRAYFLDNEFVAISYQAGRKYDEDFSFSSKESIDKLKKYLRSLVVDLEVETNYDLLEGLDDEIDDNYTIEYNSQILQNNGFYNGKEVEIIKKHYPSEDERHFHTVKIKLDDNSTKEIDCRELRFKYNT
jgi:hypothetical protein